MLLLATLEASLIVVLIVWLIAPWDSDGPDVGPQSPNLQFENTYNSAGQLIPLPGEWETYNESDTAGCDDDIALQAGQRRGFLELMDPEGRWIRVRPPDSDWTEMELISSSDTEAVYSAPITRGEEFTLVFSSSSTLGARLDGCADRGGQGWLKEPAR